jgi:enhancer of polycomb-like protein
MTGLIPKVPMRADGRVPDSDLHLLSEDRLKREHEVNNIIQESMVKHRIWNNGMVDHTWRPITPPLEMGFKPSFRAAVTEYLPSPPNSTSEDDNATNSASHPQKINSSQQNKSNEDPTTPFRYVSPPPDSGTPRMSFRRRIGRGGRMWMDRRGPSRNHYKNSPGELDDRPRERMEYDVDSDEDSDVYLNDPYDNLNIRYRIIFTVPPVHRDPAQHQKMAEEAQRRNAAALQANAARQPGIQGQAIQAAQKQQQLQQQQAVAK